MHDPGTDARRIRPIGSASAPRPRKWSDCVRAWRHPDDRSRQYNTISYWTDLAKLLESATFDGVFIADVLGTYDGRVQDTHRAARYRVGEYAKA